MKRRKTKENLSKKLEHWDNLNRESAHVILADAERYGGNDSLMVRWAHRILNTLWKDREVEGS